LTLSRIGEKRGGKVGSCSKKGRGLNSNARANWFRKSVVYTPLLHFEGFGLTGGEKKGVEVQIKGGGGEEGEKGENGSPRNSRGFQPSERERGGITTYDNMGMGHIYKKKIYKLIKRRGGRSVHRSIAIAQKRSNKRPEGPVIRLPPGKHILKAIGRVKKRSAY